MHSNYVLQLDTKTRCPLCGGAVWLLCREDGNNRAPWFYICYICKEVAQVGKGKVHVCSY